MISRLQHCIFTSVKCCASLRVASMTLVSAAHKDPSSLSNPHEFYLSNISLQWDLDFSKRIVRGAANLTVNQSRDFAGELHLDSRDLKIHSVKDGDDNSQLQFTLDPPHKITLLGSRLRVFLPKAKTAKTGTKWNVSISYETSPDAEALQWLAPEKTAGKKEPYVYSQCQSIHARSLLPCQDTPSVKVTYDAAVSVKAGLVALMSAIRDPESVASADGSQTIFKFKQQVPIPSYLIAIVAGALVSKDLGPRSAVWCEREFIDAAAFEFAFIDKFIQIAENLVGPYVWGRYDLLVLPPSFPYGGMENPCLTFVTPTLLAGDRSLVSVVAHEIAHSWTGNLFSCSSWEHFWLNEGHTRFLEDKIEDIAENGNELLRNFLASCHFKAFQYYISIKGEDHPFTMLNPDLSNADPEDAFSPVPYEKGQAFLWYLEGKVGGPEAMNNFLRALVEKYKFKSLDSSEWKSCFLEFFKELDGNGKFSDVAWDAWLHKPGYPPVMPSWDTSLAIPCTTLCKRWSIADEQNLTEFSAIDISAFSPMQCDVFLQELINEPPLHHLKLAKLQSLYRFDETQNAEIRFRWCRLGTRAQWEPIIAMAVNFSIVEQGRMKFTVPIVRDLLRWEKSRGDLLAAFEANRKYMHPTTISKILKEIDEANPVTKNVIAFTTC